jgi:hypothetical protein
MLRSGIILLLISIVGVTLRSLEFVYVTGPTFKVVCSTLLAVSIACFMGTYCLAQFAHHHHKSLAHK